LTEFLIDAPWKIVAGLLVQFLLGGSVSNLLFAILTPKKIDSKINHLQKKLRAIFN
jgi:hypothetical protein